MSISQMQFEMHEFRVSQGDGMYLVFAVIVIVLSNVYPVTLDRTRR